MVAIQDSEQVSFAEIERVVFREALKFCSEVLASVLEQLDEQLLQERDKQRYKVKGLREKQLDSLVGNVTYKRRYYYDCKKEEYVALLDRVLELEKGQRVSPGLHHVAVMQALRGPSYREAEASLEDLYGFPVMSHETIRKSLIHTGDEIAAERARKQRSPQGRRKVPLLHLEVDGYSVSMQQDQKRREAQLMFSHEGWCRRHPRSEDYELVGGQFYQELADPGTDFWEEASRYLYSIYDLSETQVVINGDRARWIRRGVDYFDNAIYQMDRWHMVRDLGLLLRDTGKSHEALSALYADEPLRLLVALAEGERELPEGETKKKLADLREDILQDPELVRDYRTRLREQGVDVMHLRGMGAAESQVDRMENRTGKRGQSWGKRGITGMLLALGEHLVGSIDRYTKRRGAAADVSIEDRGQAIQRTAGKVISKTVGVKQVHPPIMDAGTTRSGGLSQLFHNLSRAQPTMT